MSNRSKPDHGIGSRKRKERDVASGKQTQPPTTTPSPAAAAGGVHKKNNNWLLAGYLAHEFLSGGTLLGQRWDPPRAEANPITPRDHVRRGGAAPAAEGKRGGGPTPTPTTTVPPQQKIYADVSNLLMKSSEGAHIEGIVNPTQLAKWLPSSTV